jgi:hypothetical protein
MLSRFSNTRPRVQVVELDKQLAQEETMQIKVTQYRQALISEPPKHAAEKNQTHVLTFP